MVATTNCMSTLTSPKTDTEFSSIVFVFDPTNSDGYVIPTGKQVLNPSHIFYRPCSGIWQSVWIESAPTNYITDLSMNAAASGHMNLTINTAKNSSSSVKITVYDRASTWYFIDCMYNMLILYLGDQPVRCYAQGHCRLANHVQSPFTKDLVSRFAKSLRYQNQDGSRHGQQLHWIQDRDKREGQWCTQSCAGAYAQISRKHL